jgi:hypothetical protein
VHTQTLTASARLKVCLILAVWCCLVATGLGAMLVYELTPGIMRSARSEWPSGSTPFHDPERPTLVMFVHPRCPCSRASLTELGHLAAELPGRFSLHVVFVKPAAFEPGWEQTELWQTAQGIPGANVICDEHGVLAERFDAAISGEARLYAADGRLLFQGGMTKSRGHEGASAGRASLASLIETGHTERPLTRVFGCDLGLGRRPANNPPFNANNATHNSD